MNSSKAFLLFFCAAIYLSACFVKPSDDSYQVSDAHYQSPEYNRVMNTKVLGSLPKGSTINEVKVFPKEKATYIFVDYAIDDEPKRASFVQKWNEEKHSFSVVKIDCVGSCNSDKTSIGCRETFDEMNNSIYCACESDACAMETSFL